MARRCFVPSGTAIAWICLVMAVQGVLGQDPPPQEPPPETTATAPPTSQDPATTDPATTDPATQDPAAADPGQAKAQFQAKLKDWKELLKQLRTLKHDFGLTTIDDEAGRQQMKQKWDEAMAAANAMLPELTAAGAQAYAAAPNEDRELTVFLVKALQDFVARDRYADAAALGQALVDHQCDATPIYAQTGIAYFALHNFDKTKELLEQADKANALNVDARALRGAVDEYMELWKKEQEIRQKEAEADDLPRVKLTTTKGDIVVELYENEAPGTVGNFISLVKNGFYDGLTFHRVIAGFMAQCGCPDGDGTGGPGYTIYDEGEAENARMHFRGVLSMAKTNAPNSGGSQFFITFRPTPHLNGAHTVFGRVIEGMDVVDNIQRRDPSVPNPPEADKIIKAEVLRDRGHEYLPNKVE